MSEFSIRWARREELEVVQNLMLALYRSDRAYDTFFESVSSEEGSEEEYSSRIEGRDGICLVAEMDREIVGCLTGLIWSEPEERPAERTRLEKLFVREEYRGRGVGTALVEEFLQWSKERAVKRVFVWTYAMNEGADRLYERFGFRPYVMSLLLTEEQGVMIYGENTS